ncbi:hypothetical protein BH23PLA1_BH23PLA1_36280 [soil metagenome]
MTWKNLKGLALGLGVLGLALTLAPDVQAQRAEARKQADQARKQAEDAQREAEKAQGEAEGARRRIEIRRLDPQQRGGRDPIELDLGFPDGRLQRYYLDALGQLAPSLDGQDQGLGLWLEPVSDVYRAHLDLPEGQGLVVKEVAEESRAAEAGLKKGDILLEVSRGDVEVDLAQIEDLTNFLEGQQNKALTVKLIRGGKEETVEVPAVEEDEDQGRREYFIGISIAPLDEGLRAQLGLEDEQGIVVIETVEDSPSARAGLQANDILLSVNDQPIQDVEGLIEQIQEIGEEAATFEYLRKGEKKTVEITPSSRPASTDRPRRTGTRLRPETFRFFGPGIMVDPESGEIRRGGPPGPGPGPVPPVAPVPRFQFRDDFRIEMPEDLRKDLEQMREQLDKVRKELEQFRQKQRSGETGQDKPENPDVLQTLDTLF